MAGQQEAPGAEAEDGHDPGDVQDDADARPVQRGERRRVAVPALEEQGEGEQRQDGHGGDPDHEVEGVGGGGPAGEDVGDAPADGRRDDEGEGEDGAAGPFVVGGDADSGEGDAHAEDLRTGEALAERGQRDQSREDGLHLEDQRGQPGGHPLVHPDEQQPELADPQGQSDPDDPLPRHLRASDEEDGGQGGGQEAEGGEEERREVREADLDDDEVDPPDGGDDDGEGDVGGAQGGHRGVRGHDTERRPVGPLSTSADFFMVG
ncbi:hypothetical protein GCM10010329_37650 [Streptomyces spiroverticillatus]|uniref:Uncharacterized protein n=1 Tax=Streptomyces finlayi TaxID=67296 RepID=A0A919CAC7_9ACTN|nr:hypothetical protein GCM10010329_37650 [Streptomyces spiroverticillatus]GHC95104.1 hypothetical protein GCM10010334_33960 [Streptomyces finlayi]